MNSPSAASASSSSSSSVIPENRRILLVDDTREIHEDFRKILCPEQQSPALDAMEADLFGEDSSTSLQTKTFDVSSAYQGEEALQLVQQARDNKQPFAMAFVDVRMPPGWDGIETLAKLWEVDPNLQAVICTAFSDYSWEETFAKLGQSDRLLILKKPFDPIEVEQLANALTSKWLLGLKARMTTGHLKKMVQQRTQTIEKQKGLLENKLKELEDTRLQLVQAEKLASVGQLAAGVAHEINNPIGFIRSNLGSLNGYMNNLSPILEPLLELPSEPNQKLTLLDKMSKQADDLQLNIVLEDVQDLLQETLEGVDRIGSIVTDLHSFSHVNDEGQTTLNLSHTLQKALRLLSTQLENIEVQQRLADVPLITADGSRISNACVCLLQNAIDALKDQDKPRITLSCKQQDDKIRLEITDNGCGIAADTLPRIFDPFFTTKDVGEGTGLGLHTVQQLITELGGTIQPRSRAGIGTRMEIELPI